MENNLEEAKNLKLVLCAFEKLSGLKINFHKSELFCFGEASVYTQDYVELFGCKEGSTPFRYLGIPMSPRKLSNKDWSGGRRMVPKKVEQLDGQTSVGRRLFSANKFSTIQSAYVHDVLLPNT